LRIVPKSLPRSKLSQKCEDIETLDIDKDLGRDKQWFMHLNESGCKPHDVYNMNVPLGTDD
jgi:hypothetical protein